MFRHLLKKRYIIGIVLGLCVTLLAAFAAVLNIFGSLHSNFSDNLYTRNQPSKEIVIIAVDDKSTQPYPEGFGRFSQWDRGRFSQLLAVLGRENPKVITFDFVFHTSTTVLPISKISSLENEINKTESNKDKLKAYDEFVENYKSSIDNPVDRRFADKLEEFDNVILAATYKFQDKSLIEPLEKFQNKSTLGVISFFPDEDGVSRHTIPLFNVESEQKTYDDLGLATAKIFLKKDDITVPTEDGQMLVNFFGDPFSYKMISFVDVINGEFETNYFKNKIVLVGSTAFKEIHDEHYTPRSNSTPMPGIEFRANEIQTILDGKFLNNQGLFSQIITIAVISLGLSVVLSYLGIVLSIVVTIAAIILYIFVAHFMYRQGLIINMIYPFIAILLSYIGSWVYKYFIADRKKRDMTNAFGRYVSKDLVEQIAKNPDQVKLGGETREISVFFSDIKDSTTLSEQIAIEHWVAQINEYFTVMENVLMQSGGTLDKYEGDAIMGFWNAPVSQENHVDRAYICALTMKTALANLHQKWEKEGKPLLQFRIGVNSGTAIVGNFGSENRLDYTVMGDTVNTASRLESSANKTYGTILCVAGGKSDKVVLRELDNVLLPGKKEPVQIFELICMADKCDEGTRKLLNIYAQGLALYRAHDWASAIKTFQLIPNDPPAKVMLARCQQLQAGQTVPGLDGNMVFSIAHK